MARNRCRDKECADRSAEGKALQFRFQRNPWDVYLAVGYSLGCFAYLWVGGVGNLLATPAIIFAPGYVLTAFLFPRNGQIDWTERLVLAVGLSLAIVALLGVLLNFTPWGIRFGPVVATVTLFTVGVGVMTYWQRMRLPLNERLSATLDLAGPAWKKYGLREKVLTIALGASILVAAGAVAYVVLRHSGETFTEFYLIGPGGNTSDYPTTLRVSEPGTVIIGIANHESTPVNYTVRIDLVGVRIVYNATEGHNQTIEVNRTIWATFSVALNDGQTWTERRTFQIGYASLWKVHFLLFKDGNFASTYRELQLFIRVK